MVEPHVDLETSTLHSFSYQNEENKQVFELAATSVTDYSLICCSAADLSFTLNYKTLFMEPGF